MAIPLVMLGPGGDFVTRFDVKGHDLLRNVGQSMEQQPDTETAGSFAGYSRMPKQGSLRSRTGAVVQSVGPDGPVSIARGEDVFEHAGSQLATPGVYHPQLQPKDRQAASVASREAM